MEVWREIEPVLSIALQVILIIGLFYLAFFKSYFKEKGKNIATMEDVDKITTSIETIKTQLAFTLEAKLSFRSEEHTVLVDYYAKYHHWLSSIMNTSFAGVSYTQIDRLDDIRNKIDVLYEDMALAVGRMELYVENDEILTQQPNLALATFELQSKLDAVTYKIANCLLNGENEKLGENPERQLEITRNCNEERSQIVREYKEDLIEGYRNLFPQIQEHRRAISSHLRRLMEP